MKTHELVREGEWTTDGRMLVQDSVQWGVRIPLVVRGIGNTGHVVGAVTNIRREGSRILGDTDVTIGAHMILTCDLDFGTVYEYSDGRIEMTSSRLVAAYVNDKDKYPWPIEPEAEDGGGGANAR